MFDNLGRRGRGPWPEHSGKFERLVNAMGAKFCRGMVLCLFVTALIGCTAQVEKENSWLKVGDVDVGEAEAMVYLSQIFEDFEAYGGEEVWQIQDFDGGRSAEDVAVDAAIENLLEVKILGKKAEEMAITVDDEMATLLEEDSTLYYSALSKAFKERYKITPELVSQVFTENYLAQQVRALTMENFEPGDGLEAYLAENSDYSRLAGLSPEAVLTTYRLHLIVLRTRTEDPQGNTIPMTEEEKAVVAGRIQSIRQDLEAGADFTDLVVRHSEIDYYDETPEGVVLSETQMPEGYIETIDELTPGSYSDVLETEDAFHILKLEAVTPPTEADIELYEESFREWEEALIEEGKLMLADEAFNTIYERWRGNESIVVYNDQWTALNFLETFRGDVLGTDE